MTNTLARVHLPSFNLESTENIYENERQRQLCVFTTQVKSMKTLLRANHRFVKKNTVVVSRKTVSFFFVGNTLLSLSIFSRGYIRRRAAHQSSVPSSYCYGEGVIIIIIIIIIIRVYVYYMQNMIFFQEKLLSDSSRVTVDDSSL